MGQKNSKPPPPSSMIVAPPNINTRIPDPLLPPNVVFDQGILQYCPLNPLNSLVACNIEFGPLLCNKAIVDNGCSTLLLPWPEDATVFAWFADFIRNNKHRLESSIGVASEHITLRIVRAIQDQKPWPLLIDGRTVMPDLPVLRFVVTADAYGWQPGITLGVLSPSARVFEKNAEFALIGRKVLNGLWSFDAGRLGMLLLSRGANFSTEHLCDVALELSAEAGTSVTMEKLAALHESCHDDTDADMHDDGIYPLAPRMADSGSCD